MRAGDGGLGETLPASGSGRDPGRWWLSSRSPINASRPARTAPTTKIQVNADPLGTVSAAPDGEREIVRVNEARNVATMTGPALAPRSWNISVIPM